MTFQAAMYKGTPPGVKGIYNRLVRWWCRSDYSHIEIVFSDGVMASSSYMDKGVRFKNAGLAEGKWDMIDLPPELEAAARQWFIEHEGQPYDLLGHLHFIVSPIHDGGGSWFCTEAAAAALGLSEAWRYDPGVIASTLGRLSPAGPARLELAGA